MCVVDKQFDLILDSVYVDLQYNEISLTFTAGSVCFCGVYSPVVLRGLHVLLFVLHVCVLRECEGARLTAMLVWGPGEV